MKALRIPLRVLFDKNDGDWVAHSLEFDLMGEAASQQEAIQRLGQAIAMQVEATVQYNYPANLFKPADAKYFLMFAAGKDSTHGELHIQIDAVTIDDAETREYTEDDAGLAVV